MLDPISDMLTRIRNASRAGHAVVRMPTSRLKRRIADVLVAEGFLEHATEEDVAPGKKDLILTLKYRDADGALPRQRASVIRAIRRVSRQGQRVYVRYRDIRPVKNGYGITIISTSQGVMTGAQARKRHLGGEVICEVW